MAPTKEGRKGKLARKPEDFMDEEDLEVAPYNAANPKRISVAPRKRLLSMPKTRSSPPWKPKGEQLPPFPSNQLTTPLTISAIGDAPDSLLDLFIEQPKEALGVTILKQMGWKPGFGIGPRRPQENPHKAYLGEAPGISYPGMKTLLVPPPDTPLVVFSPQAHKEGVNLVPNPQDSKSQEVRSQLNSYLNQAQGNLVGF